MDDNRKPDWCWKLTQVDFHTQCAVFALHDVVLIVIISYRERKGKELKGMANDSFIDHRCQLCGGTDTADTALSEVIINAGYGSKHNGQQLRLVVCGECVDKLRSAIVASHE